MRIFLSLIFVFLGALVLIGCGHTNNLADFELQERDFRSTVVIDPEAQHVNVRIDTPTEERDPITGILIGIGEGITTFKIYEKLEAAIKPEGVAWAVAEPIEEQMRNRLMMRNTTDETHTEYILETILYELRISANASGIFLKIKAECSLIHRETDKLVWQNDEEQELPIRNTSGTAWIPVVSTGMSIANIAKLLEMSDKEIQDAVLATAGVVGEWMSAELQKDAAKVKK